LKQSKTLTGELWVVESRENLGVDVAAEGDSVLRHGVERVGAHDTGGGRDGDNASADENDADRVDDSSRALLGAGAGRSSLLLGHSNKLWVEDQGRKYKENR
jgi:hypothetical protein